MNTNIRRLGAFFLLVFAVMLADVCYWQVLDAQSLQNRSDNPRLRLQAASVRRGRIYDRSGVLLAGRPIDRLGFVHRFYTDPTLSQVIGYDSPRFGKSELELTYDAMLSGQEVGASWQAELSRWEHKPVFGDDLTLTINDALQRQVTDSLPNSPSAAIVADPRNGEILALASQPGFDANQVDSAGYWQGLLNNPERPLINRAVDGFYPPGSTFKLVTLSAALDTNTMTLSTVFDQAQAAGPLTVDYHIFCDNITKPCAPLNNLGDCGGRVVTPPIDLETALVCSDNLVYAQVGLALGQSRFLDYAHRFGLDQPIPFDIPVAESHVKLPGEVFDRVNLAATAFGQGGLNVTPLQMLIVGEAIAEGGAIPRPVLVKQVTAPDGSIVQRANEGTLYTPISASTATQVKQAMIQVVARGSGELAQIPGVQIAGKTGTAETGNGGRPHSWFVCFAPADHPRVAVVVIVEHGGEGATVAAPIAKRILEAALPLSP